MAYSRNLHPTGKNIYNNHDATVHLKRAFSCLTCRIVLQAVLIQILYKNIGLLVFPCMVIFHMFIYAYVAMKVKN